MKFVCVVTGFGLVFLSLISCGVFLYAIIDPVQFQMADDNNPFGPPPSRQSLVWSLAISAAMGGAGTYLLWRAFSSGQNTIADA